MKDNVKAGDQKEIRYRVKAGDEASFQGEVVHPVCATFTLAREIEWATRQFVLDMREEDEEGIGTFITIDHRAPAFVGETLVIQATVESMNGHEVICTYCVAVENRIIATGKTGQKILKRSRIEKLLNGKQP